MFINIAEGNFFVSLFVARIFGDVTISLLALTVHIVGWHMK